MTQKFADLGISKAALRAVDKMGYTEPTPIQEQAIPQVLLGRDVCAAAATGTGKTAAFLLPTMSKLAHAVQGKQTVSGPRMLVVTPTRELAEQIGEVCRAISNETGHFVATLYGGTKYGPQIHKLRKGVDIIIATPGRLIDLRERGVVNLKDIDVLVIDEADRMLDMGFWPSMETIIAETPEKRQTLLFSATLDRKVMNKVAPILNNPAMVEVAHHGETAKNVEQFILPIENKKKQDLLQAVLGEKGFDRVIVFTRTKKRAEECTERLRDAGFAADSIHSDKPQHKRKRALERFAKGKINILVATDVLARGIDVPSVDYVVNYDLPDMAEDYVHRIGRTGRAGEVGFAVSFVTRESRSELRDIEKLIDKTIPLMPIESYEVNPGILESKNKNKHGKKKRVRERDIERSKAHKMAKEDGTDVPATEFNGLRGYKSHGDGSGNARGDGLKKTANKQSGKDSKSFKKAGKANHGGKAGYKGERDKRDDNRNGKANDHRRGAARNQTPKDGFDKRDRNGRKGGHGKPAGAQGGKNGYQGGRKNDDRAQGQTQNRRKRGSASHKQRFDSPKPKSRQGISKAKKAASNFSRFYGKNGY